MTEFLDIALSFPTVIFSGMLILVVMYWLMAIVGAVDIELFDFDFEFDEVDVDIDFDADVDADIDADADVDAGSHGGFLHAMMAAIGLGRVPVTIIASILTLVSWFLCFAAVYYLGPIFGTGVFVGLGVVVGSVIVGLPITSIFTHPLKGLFEIHTKTGGHSLVGKLCKVTSGRVTESFGRGEVDDGGAGLLVSIRCETEGALTRGSRALLIEYDAEDEVFFVEPYDDLLADDDDDYADEVAFEDQPAASEIQEKAEEPTA